MNTATLERATITVARIIPARDRGKSATIKDSDGRMFGIWPDKLGLVNDGGVYEIEFSETVKNGTTYRDIKALHELQRQAPRAQAASRQSDPFVTSDEVRRAHSLSSAATPQPQQSRPQTNGGKDYYRPTSPVDARRMFLCSQMNALIASRQVTLTSQGLAEAITMLAEAYDATIGQEDRG